MTERNERGERLGVQRKSGEYNVLLHQPVIGKVKAPAYPLPSEEHCYGRPNPKGEVGAGATLSEWKQADLKAEDQPGRNFVALNRVTVAKGGHTAKDARTVREEHDIRLKPSKEKRSRGGPLPSDGRPTFTYGKPSRPSTPLGAIMRNEYQNTWVNQMKEKEAQERAFQQQHAFLLSPNSQTNASLGHMKGAQQKLSQSPERVDSESKSFKLSKFNHVSPKVHTH